MRCLCGSRCRYLPNITATAIFNDAEIVSDIIIMPSTTNEAKRFDTVENIQEHKQKCGHY